MGNVKHGEVKNGGVVFSEPLGLAEGTQVTVVIEPLSVGEKPADPSEAHDFDALPFFGMWADRGDMEDSAAWVRQERDRWQQRAARQD